MHRLYIERNLKYLGIEVIAYQYLKDEHNFLKLQNPHVRKSTLISEIMKQFFLSVSPHVV